MESASHKGLQCLGGNTIVDTAHILVVDDEEAIREAVSTMLESRGYKCTALSNGRAAQEFVRSQTPHRCDHARNGRHPASRLAP
jgi:PleD family two-component response regulator